LTEFGSGNGRVDLINSMNLMIIFGISGPEKIEKFKDLSINISVYILEFHKVLGFLGLISQ